jgi:hypothetical protein
MILRNNGLVETSLQITHTVRQQGAIVFLNLILSDRSSVLTYLSEHTSTDLTIKNSLHDAINMLSDESNLPICLSTF